MSRALLFAILGLLLTAAILVPNATAQGNGPVGIIHSPPMSAVPGQQIDLAAILENATSAVVVWNNGSLPRAASLPMTNLSQRQDGGWAYEAWLPAQPDGTQVTYSIAATGPAGTDVQNYSLVVVSAASQGLTPADQQRWFVTMGAVLSMALSTIVAIYVYVSVRLRRERE